MRYLAKMSAFAIACVGLCLGTGAALAQTPNEWNLGFQDALSPSMERIVSFNDLVFVIIVVITVFVFALMAWILFRYNAKRNPTPQKWTHNTFLEVLWTVVPVIILLIIAVPSFRLLYYTDSIEEADVTLKAIGYQWYWGYEYPDQGDFAFDAVMLEDDELTEGQPRLLETDVRVVLPVDTNIRLLTVAADVIHAWAIPALGVKLDAVPGRTNETWFRINREGVYYGQCSELCGTNHAFMPIAIEAVSKEAFAEWVEMAKVEYARTDTAPSSVAALDVTASDAVARTE